jgi:hypothetical protein
MRRSANFFIPAVLLAALLPPAGRIERAAAAEPEQRLIDGDPFDEITLDQENKNAVLRTFPLEFKDRRVPENPQPNAKLRLRLVSRPKRLYDCEWRHITKVRLFEQMVLEEAERLTTAEDYTEAYQDYAFLLANYPHVPGLQNSVDAYLYRHAGAEVSAKQYERAFELLAELARRNPNRKGLDRALDSVTKRVITERVKAERFLAARGAIDLARRLLPEAELPEVAHLRERLIAEAGRLRDQAKSDLAAGQLRKAQLASRQALAIWPDLDGVRALAREIDQKYPVVSVGVLQGPLSATHRELDDWPSRRISRLLARQPVELMGFSPEGGVYRSPLGNLEADASGTRWTIQLRPGIVNSAGVPVTGYEVARLLLQRSAKSDHAAFDAWNEALRAVTVRHVYGVEIQLARSLIRPERLLQTAEVVPIPWPQSDEASTPEFLEPYRPAELGEESRFQANRDYFGFTAEQPQELFEQHFGDPDDAMKALRRGEIDVLDRVCPWEVGSLASSENIVTGKYLLPTVHVLVPNMGRSLPANRTFRRAVLYGINRDMILNSVLLTGRAEEGSQVVSGPFPASASMDDPAGYGSDNRIQPAPYEPRLAIALQAMATKELNPKAKTEGPEKKEQRPVVLAHANDPVHRLACAAIAEQLKRTGMLIELVEYDSAKSGLPEDCDLHYAELAAWEPVVDARRLLGEHGITGHCNAYLSLALAKLDRAETWKEIRIRLGEIHRLVADELVVIPLYQTVNHYAFRRDAAHLGTRVVSLYEDVESWKQKHALSNAAR